MPIMTATRILPIAVAVALALALAPAAPARGAGFVDVLDTKAVMSPLATRSLLQAVTRAGDRLVAVGPRGHVVVSGDGGATWKQSPVPVSSDLTAVHFVDGRQGWAVGHDGVVLHTADGGDTWQLQLDGRRANALLVEAMERMAAAAPASADAQRLLAEARRYAEQGPDKPFLDVWFADAGNGYVVGAYNLIFRTADGGRSWDAWFDRTDNPKFFNLYAIRPAGDGLFVVGEGGLVMKLDRAGQRFNALAVSYTGSFFGVTAAQNSVLAFGLRGNVFRSEDNGATWVKADAGLPATIVAATRAASGATLLADAGGRVTATEDGGRTFHPIALKQPMPLTGLTEAGAGRLAVTGPRGVNVTEAATR
jgi:photosystem II stability/assembly factor-like uncharacterized protein